MQKETLDRKKLKVAFLFVLITFGFLIFISTLFYWSKIDRHLPKLQTSDGNTALRGNILSGDGYTIATSKKLYKVMVDTRNIDKNKLNLFVNLYSIYSGDDKKKVKRLLKSNKGSVILSYKLDAKKAKYLQNLSRRLYKMGVFKSYEDPKTGVATLRAMSVVESGEDRLYTDKKILTPVIGYVRKIEKGEITKITGVKGIERSYEEELAPIQDALVIGPKDIGNNVILNRDSRAKKRLDGLNVVLNISMKLQKTVEDIIDREKERLKATEIVAAVMESETGKILALASSNRFDPDFITKKDYKSLNPTVTEFAYEPGSVMKPVILSILLREDKVNPYDLVNVHNGRYKLGRRTIRDSHKFKYLSAEDVIVHSSNIGILQLAQKLSPTEYHQGLQDFGFSQETGIDLPYEHEGNIPSTSRFRSEIYKATVGYGYGIQATFMQILRAFNVFNDSGKLVTPRVADYAVGNDGRKHELPKPETVQVLPVSVAKQMKRILIKTVEQGTGKKAITPGLIVGGKTGTAHIAVNGRYANIYNGSFMGFANDEKHHYTIGVLTREPKKRYYYFGAQSAAPSFKKIVDAMIKENYLVPKIDENATEEDSKKKK